MSKIKRVKVRSSQELYKLKNVKVLTSVSGELCTIEFNNGITVGYTPGEIFRVVSHSERYIAEDIVSRFPEVFEEIEE